MKRKTNVFYLNNDDSNFITFSNYTESMTNNFLSVNTKLIITHFICLNLKFDNDKTLIDFKKFLICYYENKLAYLRDKLVKDNINIENNIFPLKYLFDTIATFFGNGNPDITIQYISDISEQQYNGEYSSNICVVDLSKHIGGTVTLPDNHINKSTSENNLYGWSDEEIDSYDSNEDYTFKLRDLESIYDEDNGIYNNYSNESNYTLKIGEIKNNSLSFNCIIPMFRLINIDPNSNNEYGNDELEYNLDLDKDIPMGIWINNIEKLDNEGNIIHSIEPITLYKSGDYSQSWSLTICSKFSPFPFGKLKANNLSSEQINNINDVINYKSYADLLAEQSKLLEKINDLIIENNDLKEQLTIINNKINNIKTFESESTIVSYIDQHLLSIKNNINTRLETLENQMSNLKWKNLQ